MSSLLSDEILTDPIQRGYSGMNNIQVADSLAKNKDRNIAKLVERGDVIGYLVIERKYIAIKQSTESSAVEFITALEDLGSFDLSKQGATTNAAATVSTLLDELVTAGLLNATDKAVILSLATEKVSRQTELGIVNASMGAIEVVRGKD
ncbi:MAG: hypothetical protein JKY48_15080 [Flavobacteriales bacterium]|nr:hypothetical protein [Flavobacteriales bacterium]